MDYANRLVAAAGTTVTVNGANQRYVPAATSTAGSGETSNVDNRTQSLTISVGGGTVKVGDAFTIAGVNAVHRQPLQVGSEYGSAAADLLQPGLCWHADNDGASCQRLNGADQSSQRCHDVVRDAADAVAAP